MIPSSVSLAELRQRMDEVTRFLAATLSIANAHTVEFYTHDVWSRFMAVPPEEVLNAIGISDHQGETDVQKQKQLRTTFGFCQDANRLVDPHELLRSAKAHSLPGLGVCTSRDELLEALRRKPSVLSAETVVELEPDEFMNIKKSHEVQSMAEVVDCLAKRCGVKQESITFEPYIGIISGLISMAWISQVIDVGSGKGYLSSFLSLQHGLRVFGIDSSSINTRGAQERNRKLKKFSKVYQKHRKAAKAEEDIPQIKGADDRNEPREAERQTPDPNPSEELFLSAMSLEVVQSARVSLTDEERQRRKKENLQKKAQIRSGAPGAVFSSLTSYVTAETELRELIEELEDAVLVGLHTCGDLAPSMLRMFAAKAELLAVCGVGCCYNKLSEEFEPDAQESSRGAFGFPLSQHLRRRSWFCGRNARMSACLALERVSVGHGIQMDSLFYRAVLHVILRDHYNAYKSEKRVGNIYSKAKSFVDYVRRALRKLDLDDSKLSDEDIQRYHDVHAPRRPEMHAFNLVTLAPCIEGLILMDRLCYLKEQDEGSFSALVQLFDPLLSPRCYAIVALKE
ncbi:methyltransferase-like protein 25 isoform X2 [Hippocampus zosterae]|uniref:methyltransferase-like protein 25 isoform X2 n=1 Tax=Hippocampus zosterae TaxID=109293 RepID=UPI00223C9014|nr:methyltransferase-like protein 25 isoform X2 [Hippocampus zosterae]